MSHKLWVYLCIRTWEHHDLGSQSTNFSSCPGTSQIFALGMPIGTCPILGYVQFWSAKDLRPIELPLSYLRLGADGSAYPYFSSRWTILRHISKVSSKVPWDWTPLPALMMHPCLGISFFPIRSHCPTHLMPRVTFPNYPHTSFISPTAFEEIQTKM